MNTEQRWRLRLGVLTELVERSQANLGRTAIMKLSFLLQVARGVPLGYNFRMYTYGPYQSDVLDILGQAESMGAVESKIVPYPSGSGYVFSAGPERVKVKAMAGEELAQYEDAIAWALGEFGNYTASELELLSTIVFADRDAEERSQQLSPDELARLVREIKPRFAVDYVLRKVEMLNDKGLLRALAHDRGSNRFL